MATTITTTDSIFYDKNRQFSAKKFIRYFDNEARNCPYDRNKPERGQLPPYYDEAKFKRAQLTFEKYKYCFLLVKLAGLVALLYDAVAVKIIMLTNRSSTPATASVRYRDTLRHVITWYTSDFQPGSRLWKSIGNVKDMHYSANLKANKVPNVLIITQRELAATVYGFIGFAITNPECFGLQDLTDEESEAIVHFWRVICYVLGVDDRFNLCRESFAETKAIFNEVVNYYFKRYMILKHPNTEKMQLAALKGLQKAGIRIRPKVILNFLNDIVLMDRAKYSWLYYDMNIRDVFYDMVLKLIRKLLRYGWFRNIANTIITRRINKLLKEC